MVEGVDAEARIVGAGEKGIAGAEAGAEHAEVLVALLLEPVEAAANVDDGLAAGHEGAADVGADGVVGALELSGAANVVVGHGEAQRRDAHAIEDGAERVVAEAVGVPLRQDDDGLLGPRRIFVRGRGIPAGVDQIVFGVGRALRRGEAEKLGRRELSLGGLLADGGVLGQGFRAHIGGEKLGMALFEAEVGGPLVAEELVAVADEELVDADHGGFCGGGVVQHFGPGTAAPRPWLSRKGAIHSKPHSSGRTTRFSSRVVSRVSHSYIQRAYHSLIIDMLQFYQRAAGRKSSR